MLTTVLIWSRTNGSIGRSLFLRTITCVPSLSLSRWPEKFPSWWRRWRARHSSRWQSERSRSAALSHAQSVMLLCSLSFFVAEGIKTYLKLAFGRTWPETWIQGNPSLIRDGVYGFHPFHGGIGFTSFPSGHITAVCAVLSVLWICYPKFRPLYLIYVLTAAAFWLLPTPIS